MLLGASIVSAAALSLAAVSQRREEPVHEPFIAFARDFDGFDRWQAFEVVADKHAANVHAEGPRTVYLNQRAGLTDVRFPLGTMIVKVIRVGERKDWPMFAMVKRGGGYNRGGAYGWEWFQLARDEGTVRIQWRGTGPPNDEAGYQSGTDCNKCHMEWSAHNDAVQSVMLETNKRD